MLLTQGVPYIDREQLGLSYISCPSLLRFRGPRHDNINLYISLYIVDHYLNIGLLELWSIVCQIHIEKESDVWFGRYSQWLAQLADLPRQPFGLVFSLHSMQTSWGLLVIKHIATAINSAFPRSTSKETTQCSHIWVNLYRTGKMVKMWIFSFFWSSAVTKRFDRFNFLNCSEEILPRGF